MYTNIAVLVMIIEDYSLSYEKKRDITAFANSSIHRQINPFKAITAMRMKVLEGYVRCSERRQRPREGKRQRQSWSSWKFEIFDFKSFFHITFILLFLLVHEIQNLKKKKINQKGQNGDEWQLIHRGDEKMLIFIFIIHHGMIWCIFRIVGPKKN